MTTLIVCLFIASVLPFIAKVPVAYAMHQLNGYDNLQPRTQQAKLTGFGARALAAHQNAFESLIIFAPAVLLAIATKTFNDTVSLLAISHVIARVMYNLLYLVNLGLLRSIAWALGLTCSLMIIWQCLP